MTPTQHQAQKLAEKAAEEVMGHSAKAGRVKAILRTTHLAELLAVAEAAKLAMKEYNPNFTVLHQPTFNPLADALTALKQKQEGDGDD